MIAAVQAQSTPVGWVLTGSKAGVVWNQFSDAAGWQARVMGDVNAALTAIGSSSALLVIGNAGLAATQNVASTDYADCAAQGQLLSGVEFHYGQEVWAT